MYLYLSRRHCEERTLRRSNPHVVEEDYFGHTCLSGRCLGEQGRPRMTEYVVDLLNQIDCFLCLIFKKIGIDLIGFLPCLECAVIITVAIQAKAIP